MAIVNYLAGSHEHFTVLIRTILVLELFSHSLDFGLSVRYTDQVSPCNAVEGVASWADFTVDLVTTTDAIVRWSQRSAETYSEEIKKTEHTKHGRRCSRDRCVAKGRQEGEDLHRPCWQTRCCRRTCRPNQWRLRYRQWRQQFAWSSKERCDDVRIKKRIPAVLSFFLKRTSAAAGLVDAKRAWMQVEKKGVPR